MIQNIYSYNKDTKLCLCLHCKIVYIINPISTGYHTQKRCIRNKYLMMSRFSKTEIKRSIIWKIK